jgi:hypothetical protein
MCFMNRRPSHWYLSILTWVHPPPLFFFFITLHVFNNTVQLCVMMLHTVWLMCCTFSVNLWFLAKRSSIYNQVKWKLINQCHNGRLSLYLQCIFSWLDCFEYAKWGFHLNIYTKCTWWEKYFPCLLNFFTWENPYK